jgi:hypothetical protein
MPRPLLLLNPNFNVVHDAVLGPAVAVNTSTDLLHLGSILGSSNSNSAKAASPPAPETGTALPDDDQLEIETFNPAARAKIAPPAQSSEPFTPLKLLLNVKGRKSLNKDYYDTATALELSRTMPTNLLQRFAVDAQFDASRLPQGAADFLRNAVSVGAGADLHLVKGPIQLVSLGARYRWSRNRFTGVTGSIPPETSTENGFEARAAIDGVIKQGLFRTAVWFDRATLDHARGSYTRAAILAGYGKDIPIPHRKDYSRKITVDGNDCYAIYAQDPIKSEQTIGFEVLAGAGRASTATPEYARFYGGSELGSFLYDDLSSPDLSRAPFGPILRASKLTQAGVFAGDGPQRGGTSYWHANVNLSIPVPRLSYPLIPQDWVTTKVVRPDDPENLAGIPAGQRVCVNLRQMIKNAVRVSGKELLIAQLSRDKLSEQQKDALRLQGLPDLTAQRQAELRAALDAYAKNKITAAEQVNELFGREIFPITDFIADHANFFAIKPLLMFDVGRNRLRGAIDDRTRIDAGGGLQIDLVLARIEFGYVAALRPLPGDGRGNFVARLFMKRFF